MEPGLGSGLENLYANGVINYDAESYIMGTPSKFGVPKEILDRPLGSPFEGEGPKFNEEKAHGQPKQDTFSTEKAVKYSLLALVLGAIGYYPAKGLFKYSMSHTKGTSAYRARIKAQEAAKAAKVAKKAKFAEYGKYGAIAALAAAGVYGIFKLASSGLGQRNFGIPHPNLSPLPHDLISLKTPGSQTPNVPGAPPMTMIPPQVIIPHKEMRMSDSAPQTQAEPQISEASSVPSAQPVVQIEPQQSGQPQQVIVQPPQA